MKIPIKAYVPDPYVVKLIEDVLAERYPDDRNTRIDLIAREYTRLLAHHEEETKWMYNTLLEMERAAVEIVPAILDIEEMGGES